MTYTAERAHAAVAKGAEWMDQHCPHWANHIDLAKLDLSTTAYCILGQTASCLTDDAVASLGSLSYDRVLDWITLNMFGLNPRFSSREARDWAEEHGFTARMRDFDIAEMAPTAAETFSGRRTVWEMLNIAWVEAIRQRLSVGEVTPA
jgi:hypothetical protein